MTSIAVIDFGSGNLRSVSKAIEHVAPGCQVRVTDDRAWIEAADRVVFPGQGAIGACVATMAAKGLREVVVAALETKPFLGICLGLQALFPRSEEDGGTECIGWLHGGVQHFTAVAGAGDAFSDSSAGPRLKIPHMGWNQVQQTQVHPLWRDIDQETRFYFVHSYCAQPALPEEVYGVTEYGVQFAAAAGRGNVFAVQFHPEKSQHAGLTLLRNFVAWDGQVRPAT